MAGHREIGLTHSYIKVPPLVGVNWRRSLGDRLNELARENPDKLAFIFRTPEKPRETLSRKELLERARAFGSRLIRLGIKLGDKIAVLITLGAEWIVIQFGLYMIGATAVNSLSFEPNELVRAATRLGCVGVIIDKDNGSNYGLSLRLLIHSPLDKKTDYDLTNYSIEAADNIQMPNVPPDTQALLAFTSGSSGSPKLAAHTHTTLLVGAFNYNKLADYTQDDVVAYDRPMIWMGGYPLHFLGGGMTMVYILTPLASAESDRFYVQAMVDEKPTSALLMEYRIKSIINNPNLLSKFPRLSSTLITGQRVTQSTVTALLQVCDHVNVTYGSTECHHFFMTRVTDPSQHEDGDIGYPGFDCHIKIINTDGSIAALGEKGELCIRGDGVVAEYLNLDGNIRSVLDSDGWFNTEDIAVLESDGKAQIIGRKTEMIKRATVKIFPGFVERKLMQISDILKVMVVGVNDDRLHQEICACVILKPSSQMTVEELRTRALDIFHPHLSPDGLGFMPGHFLVVKEFPTLPASSKPNRALLVKEVERILGVHA